MKIFLSYLTPTNARLDCIVKKANATAVSWILLAGNKKSLLILITFKHWSERQLVIS